MNYDVTRFGRASRVHGGEALRDDWRRADEANERTPGAGEWVPVDAVMPREDINPRREGARDRATVERYADAFDALPPITVQRDTFALVDGRHRLDAARLASRDLIRIVERDLPDDELIDHAVKANVEHGRPASAEERKYWAKDFLRRHPDWSEARIAAWTGASERVVRDYKRQMSTARDVNLQAPSEDDQLGQSAPVEAPRRVLGKDDKWRDVAPIKPPARVPARSFDPGPEPDTEAPTGDSWDRFKVTPERTDVDPETGELAPEEEPDPEDLPYDTDTFLAWGLQLSGAMLAPLSARHRAEVEAAAIAWVRRFIARNVTP